MQIEKVVTDFGVFWAESDDLITQQLRQFGAHTRPELAMVLAFVEPGYRIFDVGGHIGTFAIPMTRAAGPTGHTWVFEATAPTFDLLTRNVGENGLQDRMTIRHAIVSDRQSGFVMRQTDKNSGATEYLPDAEAQVLVDCVRLDDLTDALPQGTALNVLKIDAEGMELDVLRSARGILDRDRPLIYLEINRDSLQRHGVDAADVGQFLATMGYRFFRNAGPRNASHDDFQMVEHPPPENTDPHYDVLCIPDGSAALGKALKSVAQTGLGKG